MPLLKLILRLKNLFYPLLALILLLFSCKDENRYSRFSDTQSDGNCQWGYMDKNGKTIISPQFEDCQDYSEGYAAVKLNGKWGYIDTKGKWIVPPQFLAAWSFKSGLARVVNSDGLTAFIQKDGRLAFHEITGEASDFYNGLAKVYGKGGVGLIDTKGKLILQHTYEAIGSLQNDLIKVKRNDKWGVVNRKGNTILSLNYLSVEIGDENYITAKTDSNFLIFKHDKLVKKVTDCDWVGAVRNKILPFKLQDKMGLTTLDGKVLLNDFQSIYEDIPNGWLISKDGLTGKVDKNCVMTIDPSYKTLFIASEGFRVYQASKSWGFLDSTNTVLNTKNYDVVWNFKDGMARVAKGQQIGFINAQGQEVVSLKNIEVRDYQNGMARFCNKNELQK